MKIYDTLYRKEGLGSIPSITRIMINNGHFDMSNPLLSTGREFKPWCSVFMRESVGNNSNEYIYYKPIFSHDTRHSSLSSYSDLFDVLFGSRHGSTGVYSFIIAEETYKLYAFPGTLFDDKGDPLFVLGISDYDSNVIEEERIKFFISHEFISKPIYKNVWKKFEKEVLADNKNAIEFLSSSQINKLFFEPVNRIEYKNISEMVDKKNDVSRSMKEVHFLNNEDRFVHGLDNRIPSVVRNGFSIRNLKVSRSVDLSDEQLGDAQALLMYAIEHNLFKRGNKYVAIEEILSYRETHYDSDTIPFGLYINGELLPCEYNFRFHQLRIVGTKMILSVTNKDVFKAYEDDEEKLTKVNNFISIFGEEKEEKDVLPF